MVTNSQTIPSLLAADAMHQNGPSSSSSTAAQNAAVTLAAAETKVVGRLRLTVAGLLTIVSVAVCSVAYVSVRRSEVNDFRRDLTNLGEKFALSFESQAKQRLAMLEGFTVDLTSHAKNTENAQWPFVTLPDYHYRAGLLARDAGFMSVVLHTVVEEDERAQFVQFLQNDTSQRVGFAMQLGLPVQAVAPIPPFPDIVRLTLKGPVVDDTPGPFMVTTQIYPSRNSTFRGINHIPDPTMTDEIRSLIKLGEYVVFECFDFIDPISRSHPKFQIVSDNIKWSKFGKESGGVDYENDPVAPVMFPVFDKLGYEENRTVVGAVLGGIYWRIYLNGILPPGANDVMVILKNDCGQTYTYQLDGVDSAFVGIGDLHDNKYDDLASPIALFHGYGGKTGTEGLTTCTYTVQAFPSQAFEHVYLTADPLHYALSLAAVFIFTSLVFILYDYAVERRQQVVLRSALQAGAIVTSLFPEQVRDRLYEEQERQKNVDPRHDVTKNNQEEPTTNSPSEAIASLYPNCSVCFMDLSGFTKWSSSRSPANVFDLLESAYGSFDTIAKRHGVFKIETIGDCYVAVTGLPDARSDHAVAMAKFTSECLRAFRKLVHSDATIDRLGPETRDLALRIGIHSGEVVAGVLRGEKSRFQIFGDTVNTAARCESLGQPNRIHVSEATALILQANGKGGWLTQRADPVEAKGKGVLQTYWVNVGADNNAASVPTKKADRV